jgi:hypothetical protein
MRDWDFLHCWYEINILYTFLIHLLYVFEITLLNIGKKYLKILFFILILINTR